MSLAAAPACNVTCSLPHLPTIRPPCWCPRTPTQSSKTRRVTMVYRPVDLVHPYQRGRWPLCCYFDSVRVRRYSLFSRFSMRYVLSLSSSHSDQLADSFFQLITSVIGGNEEKVGYYAGLMVSTLPPPISPPSSSVVNPKWHRTPSHKSFPS